MSITLNPPPLQVPAVFAADKEQNTFFGGLLNTIYQLWTAVYGIRLVSRITTSDDAVTGLLRTEVPNNRTVMIEAKIVARRTGGSAGSDGDSAFYNLIGCYKNVGGTLTGIGTPVLQGGEDQASWNVGFSTSGTFAVVTVKGALNNNVTWEGAVSTYTVGS